MGMLYEYSRQERAIITGIDEDADGYRPGDINPDEPTLPRMGEGDAVARLNERLDRLTEEELTLKERMRDKHAYDKA